MSGDPRPDDPADQREPTRTTEPPPRRWTERWPSLGALLAIVVLGVSLFPYSTSLNNPNERTRMLQSRAIVERGELAIGEKVPSADGRRLEVVDPYGGRHGGLYVNDVALVCEDHQLEPPHCAGPLYPAKPPGTAVVGVPALAAARAFDLVDDSLQDEGRVTWILRYGAIFPLVLLGLLVFDALMRRAGVSRTLRRRTLLATGLGTGLFPYGLAFVGHAVAGVALLSGAWALSHVADHRGWRAAAWAALGGFATAWAVLFEYHAVVGVAAVCGWVVLSPARLRMIPGFAAGAALTGLLHAALHQAMFNSPLKTGHFFLASAHNREGQSSGFLGIDGFHWETLWQALTDPYMGLLPLMPWLVVGMAIGIPRLLWKPFGALPVGLTRTVAAIPLVYLAFISTLGNYAEMNGWSIGARYLVPAMLPMAFVAALGWVQAARWHPLAGRVIAGLAAASVIAVVAVTAAFPSPPPVDNPFGDLAVPLLDEGYAVRNLWMSLGPVSISLIGAGVCAIAAWVAVGRDVDQPARRWPGVTWRELQARPQVEGLRLAGMVLAAILAWGWIDGLADYGPNDPAKSEPALDLCRRIGEGVRPIEVERSSFLRSH